MNIRDVLIVGAGPCGLAVAAHLSESMPAANFSDDEHQRYHWIQKHRKQLSIKNYKTATETRCCKQANLSNSPLDILALDAEGGQWMARWHRLFTAFDIPFLRSPMFFHVDPQQRDGLLAYAHRNDRGHELREIRGCVGKELSKHKKKKRVASGQQREPTVDERDRNDYFVPSTPLFSSHCGCIRDRYNLNNNIVSQETVEDIRYGYVDECSETEKIFTVQTDKGCHHARVVVLAAGGNPPQIPGMKPCEQMAGATHAMRIKDFPSQQIQKKIAARISTNVLIVGGGLTSAQLADLAIRRGVSNVWLIMRGPLKAKHFDIGLEWVGKFRNFEQAAFWTADSHEERWEMFKNARNGGSITPTYKKVLEKHQSSGKLRVLQHTTIDRKKWDPDRQTWQISLSVGNTALPAIDHIYFATGVQGNFEELPFLRSMCADYPIPNCGGLPCINDDMAWRDDVPLFVGGRLAGLQLGPGAPNLIGCRIGAERIAWSIRDTLGLRDEQKDADSDEKTFDYVTARGGRFSTLAEMGDGT